MTTKYVQHVHRSTLGQGCMAAAALLMLAVYSAIAAISLAVEKTVDSGLLWAWLYPLDSAALLLHRIGFASGAGLGEFVRFFGNIGGFLSFGALLWLAHSHLRALRRFWAAAAAMILAGALALWVRLILVTPAYVFAHFANCGATLQWCGS